MFWSGWLEFLGISGIFFVISAINMPESEVPGGLINFSFSGFQGLLSFSFSLIKFILEVFSGIPKVFQRDISLSGILLLVNFGHSRVSRDI